MAKKTAKRTSIDRRLGERSGETVRRPGPKPSLTLDQIARAAIRLADAEGLQTVSMERVARKVKMTTMALYRYLPGKQALIEIMIENVATGAPDLKNAKGWRESLIVWMTACRSLYREHSWLLQATIGTRRMGPKELSWLDSALGILAQAGVPESQRHDIFLVLIGHVRSNAEFECMNSRATALRWDRRVFARDYRESLPALVHGIESGTFPGRANQAFEVGLNCILRGIESLTQTRKR